MSAGAPNQPPATAPPINLEAITEPTPTAVAGAQDDEKDFLAQVELDTKKETLEGIKQDRGERKLYAARIFSLMKWWVLGVFAILLFQGFLSNPHDWYFKWFTLHQVKFQLSDGVLIAVVSGTTASVIGIFLVVANYLFPKR